MIIAMAGHVDHGKTALIRALTGVDTDRLADEKRRGMTIDLGFAYVTLPDGRTVGFVDVPGHERFLQNMLAGVLAVDSVLLIVAADDGPMPQTLEHMEILRLTGVADLTAVITKTDRVDPARLAAAEREMRALLVRTGYGGAPVLAVSAIAGQGMDALRTHLQAKATAWRRRGQGGGFRLSVDRGFVLAGAGLIVTGTVAAGAVRVGDTLSLTPSRLAARVRAIRVQDQPADIAQAGDRCALAITGARVEREKLRRGDWLVDPALHAPTVRLDVLVRVADQRLLRHGARLHAHLAAAAVPGRARVLSMRDLPAGEAGFVQIQLDRPVAALHGDRIVLRDDGTGRILAGGRVVDPFPPERRRPREQRIAVLEAEAEPDPRAALTRKLAAEGWVELRGFCLARNLDAGARAALLAALPATLIGRAGREVAVAGATLRTVSALLLRTLGDWHAAHPDYAGPGKAALLARAGRIFPANIIEAVLDAMLDSAEVMREGAALRLPDHRPVLPAADKAIWPRLRAMFEAAGTRPPRVREVMAELGLDIAATEGLLDRLERFGRLLRVAPNRCFLPRTVAEIAVIAAELAEAGEDGAFTAAEFNRRTGIGRNLTIEVLEYLDRIGVTARHGLLRHVVRPGAEVLG